MSDSIVYSTQVLPDAIQVNIDSLAKLQEHEHADVSATQGLIEETCRLFGTPLYLGGFLLFVSSWVLGNVIAGQLGWQSFDPAPFVWLQGVVCLNGVLITLAVLIRQNRMARVSELREHLHFQINVLAEQKTTKVIKLLEELRLDSPNIRNRHDPEVEAMQVQLDHHAMLNAIKGQGTDRPETAGTAGTES